jgi:DmsE family decaheme c-type cytochrome
MTMGITGADPHAGEDIGCLSCHSIHTNRAALLVDEEGGFCGECHVSAVSRFRRRSNHPLADQAVTCMSCHDFTGGNDIAFGHGANAICARCHQEQAGPWLYEHEATSSFSTDGSGCTACHLPHGSPNEYLLTQPGDGLCRQCHGVPPLHRSKHDGLAGQHLCVECHSDIHGSYTSRTYLDPMLGLRIAGQVGGCYCHMVED